MKSDIRWKCDGCICSMELSEQCPLIFKATRWIEANKTEIGTRPFEEVVDDYLNIRPDDFRAFMLSWCYMFGGL